jgi:serine/threonine-protein kinase
MLDRPVAVKVLRADVAASPQHVERFRHEAKTLARLLHPHIATLYSLLRDGDDLFMVMEFVEGETFEAILQRERRLPHREALGLFGQALRGLAHAHHHGIVHRDVKPANFMRSPAGVVKVMDFGIARLLGSSRMTQTRHAIGTAEYMAPEQVRARDVDARTDVYALGILLYEMVAGRVPFEGQSAFETMQAHLQADPDPPSHHAPDLPPAVEAAILTALAKDPADRHASVAAFQAALGEALPRSPLVLPPPSIPQPVPAPPTVVAPPPAPEGPATPALRDLGPCSADAPEPLSVGPEPRSAPPHTANEATPPETTLSAPHVAEPDDSGDDQRPGQILDADGALVPAVPPTVIAPRPVPKTVVAPSPPPVTTAASVPEEDRAGPRSLTERIAGVPRGALAVTAGLLVLAVSTWALWPAPATVSSEGTETAPRGPGATSPAPSGGGAGPLAHGPTEPGAVLDPSRPPATTPPPRDDAPDRPIETTEPPPSTPPDDAPPPPTRPPPPPEPRRSEPPAGPPPTPRTGVAHVLVRPFGDVYVDGRRLARGTNAPVTAELAPGTYTVRATHPEFGELTERVRIVAGETAEVRLQFAVPVEVTVISDPANAEILLDGRATGRYTPATVRVVPGRHTVSVERDGYAPASKPLTVSAGQSGARLSFTLTSQSP